MTAEGQLFSYSIFHKQPANGSPAVTVVPISGIAEINVLRYSKIFIAQVVARINLLRNPKKMLRRKELIRMLFCPFSIRSLCSIIVTLRLHN